MAVGQNTRLKRIQGKYYDTKTSNKTFLKVADDLRKLGIKNYFFMLELNDPSLINVDPHSKDITADQITRVMVECMKNVWYYLREVCRIPKSGGVASPYLANRGNIAQAWCMINGVDSWLCLPRQQGKTESILAIYTWAYSFGTNDSNFIFINKDGANSKSNLNRVKDQISVLPPYMRFDSINMVDDNGKVKTVKATRNATEIKHPVTNNRILTKAKATSPETAMSLARGLTAPSLHFDEPEFTAYIGDIISNSVSTFETASRTAKENGGFYGRAFTCTPGDLDTQTGIECGVILSKTAKWTEKMYDFKVDKQNQENCELYQYMHNNSENLIVYIEYSYKQLGLTEEWLHDIYMKIGNPIIFKREILLHRIRGSSSSPFEQEQIEFLFNNMRNVTTELFILNHFRFDLYIKEFDRSKPYLIGVDCSAGIGKDNNAITIVDPYNLEVVAEFKSPYVGETLYEKILISLIRNHIPKGILCIERNNVGDSIIDHLMRSPIRMNLYYDKERDYVGHNTKNLDTVTSILKRSGEQKRYTGVWTGDSSRNDMMTILVRHMKEYIEKIYTENLVTDISRLVRNTNGKILAGSGFHDDSVMSYLICLYVYYHGNNLTRFGFIKGSEEIQNQNQGMDTASSLFDNDILPQDMVDDMRKKQQAMIDNDYERNMRKAMEIANSQTRTLVQKGLITDSTYSNTPSFELDSHEYRDTISLSLFDDLN